MKINFACGKQTWPDFYCVDAVQHPKASRPIDLRHAFEFDRGQLVNPLPLDDGCATELHSYHFIEHVYHWEAAAVIQEFRRLLRPGGLLVIECPNLWAACKQLLSGATDQLCMWPLYGDPGHKDPFMCHRWGYTPKTLEQLLKGNGFTKTKRLPPKTHGKRANRDMRMEAIRA